MRTSQSGHSSAAPSFGAEMWSSVEDLFWDHMKEVENKWNTLKLNDDIWAKLIYFEQNRRLAKAYVSAPVLTVDGSTHGLDGFRIGLSGIDNTYRNLDSIGCLRSIGQGIKLRIDNHGNILIRRVGQNVATASAPAPNQHCSVWVKDWPPSSIESAPGELDCNDENYMMRKILHSDTSYKLFDMRKFRLQLEERKLNNDNITDWRQCVSIISFVLDSSSPAGSSTIPEESQHTNELLENPCWLMLINIIAIDMIKNTVASNSRAGWDPPGSLAQNHSLLESGTNLATRQQLKLASKGDKPLRSSSSSSVLYSPEGDSTLNRASSGAATSDSTTGDSTNNLVEIATSERIKKLRTTSSKYRMSPSSKNNAYNRRFQSIQQLSSLSSSSNNNNIYTTFNSNYINRPAQKLSQAADYSSSTSDYNSASRSTSSGQLNKPRNRWMPHQQQQQTQAHQLQGSYVAMDSLQARIQPSERYRENGKALFSRKALVPPGSLSSASLSASPPLDLHGGKSVSLSAFDLSQRKRYDLRTMQSSIKMNYDYLTETEDLSDFAEDEFRSNESVVNNSNSINNNNTNNKTTSTATTTTTTTMSTAMEKKKTKVVQGKKMMSRNETLERSYGLNSVMILGKHSRSIQPANCCCGLMEGEKLAEQLHVNHNKCQAIQGSGNGSPELGGCDTVKESGCSSNNSTQLKSGNKISKSSIASSTTSSSGCADNDYFMSNSSSSMSSSTASNERELFSQPPSSSGIVGSAGSSTNDELDDGRNTDNNNKTVSSLKCQKGAEQHNRNIHSDSVQPSIDRSKSADDEQHDSRIIISDNATDTFTSFDQDNKLNKITKSLSRKVKKSATKSQIQRRGYSIKTIEDGSTPTVGYCCANQVALDHSANECDCPPVEYTCHCCCDCFSSDHPTQTTCGWEDDSIYQKLPPPPMRRMHSPAMDVPQTKGKNKDDNGRKIRDAEVGGESLGKETAKLSAKIESSKQSNSGSWLERRKYGRIFPKFIFSSSSSSSSSSTNSNNNACSLVPSDGKKSKEMRPAREKESRFRFTRSTQELS